MNKYTKEYEDLAERSAGIMKNCSDVMGDFMKLHDDVCKDGVLSLKQKELIALGIAINIRCHDCILAHCRTLKAVGATMEEIKETVEVSIMMGGGPSTAYGSLALDVFKDL